MRKRDALVVIFFFVGSFTPAHANPPLCEGARYSAVPVPVVVAEPIVLTEPHKVVKFEQFSVRFEETAGNRRMMIFESPPAPEWARVSTSPD